METVECGVGDCGLARLEATQRAGRSATLLVGGWAGQWLNNVTILREDGRSCPGPSLPIWLADHFSVFDGSRILTCGGR